MSITQVCASLALPPQPLGPSLSSANQQTVGEESSVMVCFSGKIGTYKLCLPDRHKTFVRGCSRLHSCTTSLELVRCGLGCSVCKPMRLAPKCSACSSRGKLARPGTPLGRRSQTPEVATMFIVCTASVVLSVINCCRTVARASLSRLTNEDA